MKETENWDILGLGTGRNLLEIKIEGQTEVKRSENTITDESMKNWAYVQ